MHIGGLWGRIKGKSTCEKYNAYTSSLSIHPVLSQILIRPWSTSKLTKPLIFSSVITGTTSFLQFTQFSTRSYLKFFFQWAIMILHSLGSSSNSFIFSFFLVGFPHGHRTLSPSHSYCFSSDSQIYISSPYWVSHSYMWMQKTLTGNPFSAVPHVSHV